MGNTPSQIANNISSAISNTMIQSITNTSNDMLSSQIVNLGCNPQKDTSGGYFECISGCKNEPTCINTKCRPIAEMCKAENISLDQLCIYNITEKAKTNIDIQTKNTITTILNQYNKDSNANQLINNIGKQIVADTITDKIVQHFTNTETQSVTIDNKPLYNISLSKSVNENVNDVISDTKSATLIKDLSIHISQVDNGPYNSVLHGCIIFISVFVVVLIILLIKKSKSFQDFVDRFLPFLIWFFICLLVTLIHFLIKPSYICDFPADAVSEKDKYNRRQIDMSKFIRTMAIWYSSIALLITIIFVIIKVIQNRKNK